MWVLGRIPSNNSTCQPLTTEPSPQDSQRTMLAITIVKIKAMLTFRLDLACLEPTSFLLKTLGSFEWAWHIFICTCPRMGFQICKRNYGGPRKHANTSHTALCSSKPLSDPSKQGCEGQHGEAAQGRCPDQTALTGHADAPPSTQGRPRQHTEKPSFCSRYFAFLGS